MFSQGNAQIVFLLLFTVFELGMAKVQILARTNRILFRALRFLDALQVLSHRVDRTVHVQQFAVQILFGSVVRLATTRKTESIIRFVELVSSRREIKLEQFELVYFITQLRACSDLRTLLHRRRVRASFDRTGSLDCLVGTTIQAAKEAIRQVGREVQEVQKVQSLP